MPSLFDDLPEFNDLNLETPKTELKIQKGNISLSKMQIDFNRAITRISNLEKSIFDEGEKITTLLYHYNETVYKGKIELAETKFRLIRSLHESKENTKYSKKTNEQLKEIILQFFDEIFSFKEATPDQILIYDTYSDRNYKEEIGLQSENMKDDLIKMMKEMYGFDMDAEGVDFEDPRSMAEFQAKMKELMNEHRAGAETNMHKKNGKLKKKTQKQIEREELIKAQEELKNKNIRSIYISLTKILHPDLETDTVLKQEKEELMKILIQAYEEKDLATLLKLEIEWVQKTSSNLNTIADDKLKIYLSVLKNRVKELEDEKHRLYYHPRCEPIIDIVRKQELVAKIELDHNKEQIALINENFTSNTNIFLNLNGLADRKEFISELYESQNSQSFNDFDIDEIINAMMRNKM